MHEGISRFDSSAERDRSILSNYENSLLIIMTKEAHSSSDSSAERGRCSIISCYNNPYLFTIAGPIVLQNVLERFYLVTKRNKTDSRAESSSENA